MRPPVVYAHRNDGFVAFDRHAAAEIDEAHVAENSEIVAYPALLQGLVEERECVCIHVFALQMQQGDISVPVSQQLGRSAVLYEPSAPLHCLFIGI